LARLNESELHANVGDASRRGWHDPSLTFPGLRSRRRGHRVKCYAFDSADAENPDTPLAAQTDKNIVTLGTIISSAPREALMAALRQLRPQFEVTLQDIAGDAGAVKRYRVVVELADQIPAPQQVSDWLSLKSALMARFPADKPGAVTAIDP
jgi:hypothetical protein